MQIVAKPKRGQESLPEDTPDSGPAMPCEITPGSMVACFVPQYRDEIPQIGKLLETSDNEVTIEWWIGTYCGTWRALTKRKGRSTEPWTETLPKSCMLYQVSFTKYSKIPKAEMQDSNLNPQLTLTTPY